MSTAEPRLTLLDRAFYVSLILKGLDGVLELIGGILLLVVTPAQIGAIARFLTLHELSEDPRDFIANTVLSLVAGLNVSVALFGAIYLFLHGVVKVVLVWAVLLLTVFDTFIVYLTFREYGIHRARRRRSLTAK